MIPNLLTTSFTLTIALSTLLNAFPAVLAADCKARFTDFTNCALLTPQYALHWNISTDAKTITFGVDVDTTNQWVGLGISDRGGMRTADIWILRQFANGSYYIQDSFSTDFQTPSADAQQDVTLIQPPTAGASNTAFIFSRPLVTCDSNDLPIEQDMQHNLIWAFGDISNQNIMQHTPNNRGDSKATLWATSANSTINTPPDDTQKYSIRMPNVTIPTNGTSYLCTHFEFPLDSKYQVIRFEGLAMNKYIHHMIAWGCSEKPSPPAVDGDLYQCSSMDGICSEFVFGWVPGAKTFDYPPEAGVPVGTGPNANKYFSLQVHYNNPMHDEGQVDDSGMDFYYTQQLRQHDVGVLTVGQLEINVPANKTDYTVLKPNICPSSCTSKFPQEMTLLSTGVHMHLLGHNQTVQQIRGNQELANIVDRPNYDFNYQGAEVLVNRTMVPGDTLITTCGYIPTAGVRTKNTKFGEASQSEMCFNFIQYYPKYEPIGLCLGIDQFGMAICTTQETLKTAGIGLGLSGGMPNSTAIQGLLTSGAIVPISTPTFTPYVPTCVASFQNPVSTTPAKSNAVSVSIKSIVTLFTTTRFTFAIAVATLLNAVPTVLAADCKARFTDFTNCALLTPQYALHWNISTDSKTITFGVDVDVTNQWVGLGISDRGGMRTADIWILRQFANGSYYIQDSFSKDFETPSADTQQYVTLIQPPTAGANNTAFIFSRPMVTCDPDDLSIQQDMLHNLIWAFGDMPNGNIFQHSPNHRGDAKATLWVTNTQPAVTLPDDTKILDVKMPNVTIPKNTTSFLCTHFEFPLDSKHQIIRFNGVARNKYIHHMIAWGCSKKPPAPAGDGDLYPCLSMDNICSEFVFGWAPGGLAVDYPPEAGVAVGTGKNAYKYFSLQIHYNNPNNDEGQIDDSGMEFSYTQQLRKYDVGVLVVGQVDITVPANKSEYTMLNPNICPSTCTSKFPQELTLLNTNVHMHLLGHNQTIQQIRKNQELENIVSRPNYDFKYQSTEFLVKRTLAPGDTLITTCGYIPTAGVRTNVTLWGESSQAEMCFNFIQYYPRYENISSCLAFDQYGVASCTTQEVLESAGIGLGLGDLPGLDKLQPLLDNGDIVPLKMPIYSKYEPTCVASFQKPSAPAKSGVVSFSFISIVVKPPPTMTTTSKTNNILLTGATGFIGGTILTELLKMRIHGASELSSISDPFLSAIASTLSTTSKDWTLTCLIRDSNPSAPNSRSAQLSALKGVDHIRTFQDLEDTTALFDAAKDADIIINGADTCDHLASTKALLEGLISGSKSRNTKSLFIHTSGVGVIMDTTHGMHDDYFVFDDSDPDAVESHINDDAQHREVDLM
ncbi:hypothetical protein HDU76_004290, partial [Blyttiomyces sp. JEL0837]